MIGAELTLDSLDVLGLIVADEIAETRIGMVWGVEQRGECMIYGQGATKHGRIRRMVVHENERNTKDARGGSNSVIIEKPYR